MCPNFMPLSQRVLDKLSAADSVTSRLKDIAEPSGLTLTLPATIGRFRQRVNHNSERV